MRKMIVFFILFFYVVSVLSAAPDKLKLMTKGSSEKELTSQLTVKDKNYEVSMINIESSDTNYFFGSIVTPYFGLGKLKTNGLFSESINPCSYKPGSSVFFARTYLSLDRSITDGGKNGIYGNIFPWLTFYSLWQNDDENISGIAMNFGIKNFSFAFLFQDSHCETKSSSSWYSSRETKYDGREIMNISGSMNYLADRFYLSLCAGSCFGSYIESGFYNRDFLSLFFFPWLELNIMFSGTTDNYVAATGVIPVNQYKYGAELELGPWCDVKLTAGWYNDWERPDLKDEEWNDFSQNYNCGISFSPWDFKFSVSYNLNNILNNDGTSLEKQNLGFSASYSGAVFSLTAKNTFYWEDRDWIRNYTTLTGKFRTNYIRGEASYTRNNTDEIVNKFKEKLIFEWKGWNLIFSHEKEDNKKSIFTIEISLEVR